MDGGLSVSEALDSEATGVTGVLAVKGHLYDEGAGAALCETLTGGGERYTCDPHLDHTDAPVTRSLRSVLWTRPMDRLTGAAGGRG